MEISTLEMLGNADLNAFVEKFKLAESKDGILWTMLKSELGTDKVSFLRKDSIYSAVSHMLYLFFTTAISAVIITATKIAELKNTSTEATEAITTLSDFLWFLPLKWEDPEHKVTNLRQ